MKIDIRNLPVWYWIEWEFKDGYPFTHSHLSHYEVPKEEDYGLDIAALKAELDYYASHKIILIFSEEDKEFLREYIRGQYCYGPSDIGLHQAVGDSIWYAFFD